VVAPASKLDIVGDTRLGDSATNYAEFKSDGELNLHGTARVKRPFKVFTSAELQRGTTPPSSGTLGNFGFEQYTLNDDSILNVAVLAERAAGTDIDIIIRWAVDEDYATNSGEVRWQINWSACPDDGTETLDAPTHTGTVNSPDVNIPTNAKTIQETTITISGANILNTDEFGFTLKRIALVGGTSPTEEPGVVTVGVINTMDKLGEALV